MIAVILLFAVALFFSAFFSGAETGFYRVSRVRLALDANSGNATARSLLQLTNHPTLFVATTLVGNNLANYLTTMAIVLGTQRLFGEGQLLLDIVAPVVASPVLFVYGELLPKHMFYLAPNRLLGIGGPLFLACTVLFAPVSSLLWLMGRLLELIVGESPVRVLERIARSELQRVLEEGHEAGILEPAQRQLARGVFRVASEQAVKWMTPLARVGAVSDSSSFADVMRAFKRSRVPQIVVTRGKSQNLVGYLRWADLNLNTGNWRDATRPLIAIRHDESHLIALVRLYNRAETLGEVVDGTGKTIGVVAADDLLEPLLNTP